MFDHGLPAEVGLLQSQSRAWRNAGIRLAMRYHWPAQTLPAWIGPSPRPDTRVSGSASQGVERDPFTTIAWRECLHPVRRGWCPVRHYVENAVNEGGEGSTWNRRFESSTC